MHCKSDVLINNHCEVFNSFKLNVIDKPIISMFETIRTMLMVKVRKNRGKMRLHPSPVCPRNENGLDELETLASNYISEWSVGDEF